MLETTLKKSEEGRNDAVKEIEWFRKEQKQKEKKIKDLENNLGETTKIVTFNNNNIQILIRRSILTKLPKNSMMSAISYI